MPSDTERLNKILADSDADRAAGRAGLTPDVLAALDALRAPVADSVLRPLGGLERAVASDGASQGYWFGLCYGSILAMQTRDEVAAAVTDALLARAAAIYNPPKGDQ